jgi:small subunit ribosomal protein S4
VLEKQFRHYYREAARSKGVTGEELLNLLERRLDNTVYRLGFAASRTEGRLLVRHGHVLVNGRRCDIPSFLVRPGMAISVAEKSRKVGRVLEAAENVEKRGVPGWLELGSDKFSGTVKAMPSREDVTIPIQEQLIVELYSK